LDHDDHLACGNAYPSKIIKSQVAAVTISSWQLNSLLLQVKGMDYM
jgi:hypothetical protein